MCWQKKRGSIYEKYFFNRFSVSSKILLKFFKINHRFYRDMNFLTKVTTIKLGKFS